jgi:hypothetical protein
MHRSGTSALMGVLHWLGVELGPSLLPAQAGVNDRGFWEHAEIVAVHDRLLAAIGSSWDDVCPLPDQWWKAQDVMPFRHELLHIVQRDFARVPLWGVKDPRICRLLPLWQDILAELGCPASYLIITRHPQEVACSLARRDGFPASKSYLLWLGHVLEAEQWTRTFPRLFISYAALLRDWHATIARIGTCLSLTWPHAPASVATAIEQFLDPGLRHHQYTNLQQEGTPAVPELVCTVYRAMTAAAPNPADPLEWWLAPARRELQTATRLCGPWLKQLTTELGRVGAGFSQALSQLASVNEEFAKVGAGLTQAVELLTERDTQLASLHEELAKVGAGLTQTLAVLAERDAQLTDTHTELGQARTELAHTKANLVYAETDLAHAQAELTRIRSHWLWRVLRFFLR